MPVGKDTYVGSSEMRESLLSILRDVSPNEDNYFVSNLGKGPVALQTYQEWNTYYQSRPTSVTLKAEGAQTTYADLTAEGRTGNYTAITEEAVRVSRTKASIAMVTGDDAVGKEKERALKRLKSNMEWMTINGAGPSAGLSGIARGMAGIDACISTLVTAHASGQSFSSVVFNDLVQASWNQVSGEYVMNMICAPVIIKRRAANFGTTITRNQEAASKRLSQEVRVVDSEVGPTIMFIAHKDVRSAAGTLTVYGLNDSLFEHSFLVDSGEPHWEDRAKDGDYVSGTYITEFTLASFAQRANTKSTGFSTGL